MPRNKVTYELIAGNFAACQPTACTCPRSQATLDISRCGSGSRPHQTIHQERQPWQRHVKAK